MKCTRRLPGIHVHGQHSKTGSRLSLSGVRRCSFVFPSKAGRKLLDFDAVAQWTGIHELDGVLAEVVSNARGVIGSDLVGVYLHGSFALGGVDDESDCDFLVVSSAPVGDVRLTALRAFHGALRRRPGYWNQHLEGSYALLRELADLDGLGRRWPYVDHGSDQVVLDPHCNTEVTRWTLHERGVVLCGPEPRTLFGPVPVQTMQAAAARDLSAAVQEWERHRSWDAWSQRYAVVTMPRMLRTYVVGDVVSKRAAVDWARDALDPRWRPLLERALHERGQRPWDAPIDPGLATRSLEFVRYVGRQLHSG